MVRRALLVDVYEPPLEVPPRDPQHPADQREPVPDRGALGRDGVDLRAQRIDAGVLLAQSALERVELDEAECMLGEARILLPEVADAARIGPDRSGDGEHEKRAERAREDARSEASNRAHGARTLAIAGTLCLSPSEDCLIFGSLSGCAHPGTLLGC